MKPEDFGIKDYTWNNGLLDVYHNVDLFDRRLEIIPFFFGTVYGDFNCAVNNITSLIGCPNEVKGYFYCYRNKLTSLNYCPKIIGTSFYCFNNEELTSFNNGPDSIGDRIYIDNHLLSISLSEILEYTLKYPMFFKCVSVVENPDKETTIYNLKKKIAIEKAVNR